MATCANCGQALTGEYCHACGQKRFVESDRRFGHLLHQFIESATDLDSRVWRSLRALVFRPGLLSREYFLGRRARWLAPIPLFLAVNVVYFLAPLHGGDLSLQFNQQVSGRVRTLAGEPTDAKLTEQQLAANGQVHTRLTTRLVDQRVRERDLDARALSGGARGYSYHDYRLAYDAKADDISKALIILHVPFAALALMLLLIRQRRYFSEHFVFALHFFAFALIALQVVAQVHELMKLVLPATWASATILDWFVRVLFPTYIVLAVRRAHDAGWIASIAVGAGTIAAVLVVNLYVYRTVQFLVTFALT